MLKSVMRRFGAGRKSQERQPTYLEALLVEALPRLPGIFDAGANTEPMHQIARELVRIEGAREKLELPNLSSPEVTDAAVAYLFMLVDNDRLPPENQLSGYELNATRQLLLAAAQGEEAAALHSDRILSLLEEKFNSGRFSQAAILLRLFATTPARQRNNERTLFYEEMFARFGVLRSNRIPTGVSKRFSEAFQGDGTDLEKLIAAGAWLREHANVRLNLSVIPNGDRESWGAILDSRPNAERVRDVFPHARWRDVGESEPDEVGEAVNRYLAQVHLGSYTAHLMKVCYFTVLVTGRTGYETFIRDFFQWVQRSFGFPGSRLLPELHRLTTIGERGIEETVDALRRRYMREVSSALVFGEEASARAVGSFLSQLSGLDPNGLPPGDYDLAGLLMDHATGLTATDPLALFRVHRLG
jgi:hypothetical protein